MDYMDTLYDYLKSISKDMVFNFIESEYSTTFDKRDETKESPHDAIKITNIVVDADKNDIVTALIDAYKTRVYDDKSYIKSMFLKCLEFLKYLVPLLLLLMIFNETCALLFLSLSILANIIEFNEDETLYSIKRKHENFTWLCYVLENDVPKKTFKELLEMNYVTKLAIPEHCSKRAVSVCYSASKNPNNCYGCASANSIGDTFLFMRKVLNDEITLYWNSENELVAVDVLGNEHLLNIKMDAKTLAYGDNEYELVITMDQNYLRRINNK